MTDNNDIKQHEQSDIQRTEPVIENRPKDSTPESKDSGIGELSQQANPPVDESTLNTSPTLGSDSVGSENDNSEKAENSEQAETQQAEKEKRKPYNPNADLEFPKEIRINPEAQIEQDKLFIRLNDEYKNIEGKPTESDEDFRTIRKNLVDLKEKADALFLVAKEEKESFINSIQEHFKTINTRMEEVQQKRDQEREAVYLENKDRIEKQIEDARLEENFNNGRKILIDLQSELKIISLPRNRKTEIQASVQEVFEGINIRQDEYRAKFEDEAKKNYELIKPLVVASKDKALTSEDFNASRKDLITTQGKIKSATLTRQQKDELFQEVRTAFNYINEKQDAERTEFNKESQVNYNKLKIVVQQAIDFAVDPSNFSTARQKLIDTQNEIKKYDLKLSHKNDLFGAVRAVFTKLNENSDIDVVDQEALENYEKLKQKVNEAAMNARYSTSLNDIRNGLIAVRDEVKLLKLSSKHRKELSTSIRKAFAEFDKKKDEYFKNRKGRDRKNSGNAKTKLNNQISELENKQKEIQNQIDLENSKAEHLASDDEKETISKTIDELNSNQADVSKQLSEKKAQLANL